MAWIESHQSLLTHRKTLRATAALKVSRHLLLGHLHALWWWGLDNADADGFLGQVESAELAEAAGFSVRKSDLFLEGLIGSGFMDRTKRGIFFHNWKKYTWRFYENKGKREDASASGAYGNHKRWHLDRGEVHPECTFCTEVESKSHRGSDSPRIAPDIAPDSGSESPPNRETHRTQSLPSLPPHSPTILPTDPSNLATEPRPLREHPLNLTPAEWSSITPKYPGLNLQSIWKDWVLWVEEDEEKRRPKNKVAAYEGFVKNRHQKSSAAAVV